MFARSGKDWKLCLRINSIVFHCTFSRTVSRVTSSGVNWMKTMQLSNMPLFQYARFRFAQMTVEQMPPRAGLHSAAECPLAGQLWQSNSRKTAGGAWWCVNSFDGAPKIDKCKTNVLCLKPPPRTLCWDDEGNCNSNRFNRDKIDCKMLPFCWETSQQLPLAV